VQVDQPFVSSASWKSSSFGLLECHFYKHAQAIWGSEKHFEGVNVYCDYATMQQHICQSLEAVPEGTPRQLISQSEGEVRGQGRGHRREWAMGGKRDEPFSNVRL